MKIELLSENAKVPARAKCGDAGYDLYVPSDYTVTPGRNVIPLDFKIELDHGTEAQIRPRSGFTLKGMEGFTKTDSEPSRFDADVMLGTIDEGYRGVVGVLVKSYEKEPFIVKAGTKIAQMVISHYIGGEFAVCDSLSETERGANGFGHSGSR